MSVRRLLLVASLCLGLLLLMGSAAAAGPCGTSRVEAACTILRPIPAPGQRWIDASAPECIVTVGGLGSRTDGDDGFFAPLTGPFVAGEGGERAYVERRFGLERRDLYPYDTYGAIAPNALSLRALVRDLSHECYAIDVVAHSMGGAVADRAFSLGLSVRDGVTTYLPLSSPHNGAWGARQLRLGVEISDSFASLASLLASQLHVHDPTSAAVRDLAEPMSPRPPRGVAEVRQRMVSDLVVILRDQIDRRYDVREYRVAGPDQIEGHSGVVHNADVRTVVTRTIRDHAVPAETRSPEEVERASFASLVVDRLWGGAVEEAGDLLADVARLTLVFESGE